MEHLNFIKCLYEATGQVFELPAPHNRRVKIKSWKDRLGNTSANAQVLNPQTPEETKYCFTDLIQGESEFGSACIDAAMAWVTKNNLSHLCQ